MKISGLSFDKHIHDPKLTRNIFYTSNVNTTLVSYLSANMFSENSPLVLDYLGAVATCMSFCIIHLSRESSSTYSLARKIK